MNLLKQASASNTKVCLSNLGAIRKNTSGAKLKSQLAYEQLAQLKAITLSYRALPHLQK